MRFRRRKNRLCSGEAADAVATIYFGRVSCAMLQPVFCGFCQNARRIVGLQCGPINSAGILKPPHDGRVGHHQPVLGIIIQPVLWVSLEQKRRRCETHMERRRETCGRNSLQIFELTPDVELLCHCDIIFLIAKLNLNKILVVNSLNLTFSVERENTSCV